MKSRFVIMLTIFALGLGIVATTAAQDGGTTIVVAAVQGVESAGIEAVIPQWEEMTGNTVEFIASPYADLQDRVFTDASTGAGNFDVIFIDDPWMPFLASNGFLTPLAELGYEADDDFVQRSLDVASWPPPFGPRLPGTPADAEPQLFAIPAVGNVQLFWYRNDLVEPPADIFDLMSQVTALHDPDNGRFGYTVRGARGNPVVTDFNAWNWTFGGDIFDDQWNAIINAPESVAALEAMLAMGEVSPPGVASTDADEQAIAMLNGSTMAAIIWPAFNTKIDDPEESTVSGLISVVPFPAGERQTSQLGNWLLAIPAEAQNKEVALDFITWATSPDVMRESAIVGAPPTRISIFEDPELQETFWWYPANLEALGLATWRPRLPQWSQVEDILGIWLNRAVAGEVGAQDALDSAAEEITELLTREGFYD